VDYNDYTFSVCPDCYFTGVNKKEFIYTDSITGIKNKTVLLPKVLEHWKNNPKEIEEAKKRFYYILIGLAVLISSRVIVQIVRTTLEQAGVVKENTFINPIR
jgi:uncharacterized protein (DUF2225 family)